MLGPILAPPGPENDWQGKHVARLVQAFARATGRDLGTEMGLDPRALGKSAWDGDFALLSHRGDPQATLNYGNRFALKLWEMDWARFTATPSAATAPPGDVGARGTMMDQVAQTGFVSGYCGRRVSATGKLFMIEDVTIFRLVGMDGEPFGMAATFKKFRPL